MFTGIIEDLCKVINIDKFANHTHISISSKFDDVKIGASIAVNGVCLTVVDINERSLSFDVIKETLEKTNLKFIKCGDLINIERCMRINDRIDGHIVQGHIDTTAICKSIKKEKGSHFLTFEYDNTELITVEKGSVCVNGISLTVCESKPSTFSVAIIPYTFKNTNLHLLKEHGIVNIEFDILGKYIAKLVK